MGVKAIFPFKVIQYQKTFSNAFLPNNECKNRNSFKKNKITNRFYLEKADSKNYQGCKRNFACGSCCVVQLVSIIVVNRCSFNRGAICI